MLVEMNTATIEKLNILANPAAAGQEKSAQKALIDIIDATVLRRTLWLSFGSGICHAKAISFGSGICLCVVVGSRRLEMIVSVEGVSGSEVVGEWLFGSDKTVVDAVASLFQSCIENGARPYLAKSDTSAGEESILDIGIPSEKLAAAMGV